MLPGRRHEFADDARDVKAHLVPVLAAADQVDSDPLDFVEVGRGLHQSISIAHPVRREDDGVNSKNGTDSL